MIVQFTAHFLCCNLPLQTVLVNLTVSFKHCSRSEVGNGRFPLTPTTPEILQRAKWYENSWEGFQKTRKLSETSGKKLKWN